jgi:hypothetical protein
MIMYLEILIKESRMKQEKRNRSGIPRYRIFYQDPHRAEVAEQAHLAPAMAK